MSGKYKITLFILILLAGIGGPARKIMAQTGLPAAEQKIARLYLQIRNTPDDHRKSILNDSVRILFRQILPTKEAYIYPFDSLKYTGKIYPPDSSFRIINWNLAFSDGTYGYYGFICRKDGTIIELKDHGRTIPRPETVVLTPANWYGALYYRILENKWKKKTYYTVLGIDLHNALTTRKVIDVITFNRTGQVHFGAPVFTMGDTLLYRVIFEYNAQASMLLHYDDEMEMIVFDHLSPSRPEYQGMYQFYGPDSSYDGFFFYRGKWILREDLDVRNKN